MCRKWKGQEQDLGEERQIVTGLSLIFLKLFFIIFTEISQGEILRSSGNVLSVLYALIKEKRPSGGK